MWLKIKIWFANFWLKLKSFTERFSAYWVSALAVVLMIIVGGVWLINRDAMDNNDNTSGPQIAQVFEPSIADPLPPTTEPFIAGEPVADGEGGKPIGQTDNGNVAGDFIAPPTGVDMTPVKYKNTSLSFSAELPAGTTVKELTSNSVQFVPGDNGLLYIVQSYGKTSETIESIFAQIDGSPSVSQAKQIAFRGIPAVEFTSKDLPGTGIAVIANGQLFYLIGDHTHFAGFQAI